jgi:hypothetical protein
VLALLMIGLCAAEVSFERHLEPTASRT